MSNYINYRSVRKLQTDQGSYLRNPGSEPLTHATLGGVIAETAHKYPGRVAIRSVHEDLTITYEDLLNQVKLNLWTILMIFFTIKWIGDRWMIVIHLMVCNQSTRNFLFPDPNQDLSTKL